jgi:ATP-binding cassette subfamily A (ABC1) protein 5
LEITKKFKKQKVFAVNNISLSIYESQITALLGHNGAGKTTLINILTGTISPTSGMTFIHGCDISNATDMIKLRSKFGVCLQQDILFDDLNPIEHLLYFGKIKGLSSEALLSVVTKLLIEVQLFESGFTASKYLSGGENESYVSLSH